MSKPLILRPSWDQYFVGMLPQIATRSVCLRHQIGAIVTIDNQIVTTGYNGPPRGAKHCAELGGCLREREGIPSGTQQERCRAVHAEENTIVQAAVRGISVAGGTLYTSNLPCTLCSRKIINARIRRVVYVGDYADKAGAEMLNEVGIEIRAMTPCHHHKVHQGTRIDNDPPLRRWICRDCGERGVDVITPDTSLVSEGEDREFSAMLFHHWLRHDTFECDHKKVHSNLVTSSMPPQYAWVCEVCGEQGRDIGQADGGLRLEASDGLNYTDTKGRFNEPG